MTKTTRNIRIRVDGNPGIGLGHLVRCISLARMLERHFTITFYCRRFQVELESVFGEVFHLVVFVDNEVDFFSSIAPADIVVLDGYHFDIEYQAEIKSRGGLLIVIDDLHDKRYLADLVINHSPGINASDYDAKLSTEFALGLDFVMLRPSFLEAASRERLYNKLSSLLICFGGSDFKNLTIQALRVALGIDDLESITVILGPAYQHRRLLDEFALDRRVVVRERLSEREMVEEFQRAEVAIVPASGVLLEAIACKCRVVSGMYVENQKLLYQNFKKCDLILDAAGFDVWSLDTALKRALEIWLPEKSTPIDGKSGERLIKIISDLSKSAQVSLRLADERDMALTYGWATNDSVRMYSFKREQITMSGHERWFAGKMSDTNCYYFIAEVDGQPIGSIRFDVVNREAVISYLLDPKFHGHGWGVALLKKGLEKIEEIGEDGAFNKVVGFVLPENIPSVRAFERFGFRRHQKENSLKFEKSVCYESI